MLSLEAISRELTGSKVDGFTGGIGSFFYLHFLTVGNVKYKLWVYLCDWAFLKDGYEFASSDIEKIGSSIDLSRLIGERLENIEFLDANMECHFDLTGGFRLEMWMNFDAYPEDREMFAVFREELAVAVYPGGK